MTLAALPLLFAASLSSADALVTVLNSSNAVSVRVFAEAKKTVEAEAKEGKPLQQFVVGLTSNDKALAKRYLDGSRDKIRNMAEKRNNPMAWYLLSMENNDLKLLQKAADGGNVQALNALGAMAIQEAFNYNIPSNTLERVLRRGYECFQKAVEQCDPNGFINLGTCYLRGFGCKEDKKLAFSCFKAAADAGHPEGMDNVSACYQFGHGVKADMGESLVWQMRGRAARGDAAAEKWLKERK